MELFEFRFSTFNEKVRWALEYKGIKATRHVLLPGFHMGRMKRLSGQTSTPVLKDGSDVVVGSASIVAHLESLQPEPPLMPSDVDAADVVEWQRWLDDDVAPSIRYALFTDILEDSTFTGHAFSRGRGPISAGMCIGWCFLLLQVRFAT